MYRKMPPNKALIVTGFRGKRVEDILKAAERFLGKTDQEIDKNIKEILEGHTRKVIARTSLQQLLHK